MVDRTQEIEALCRFALKLPEAQEEFPWGERVFKVQKKVFVFMGPPNEIDRLVLTVKLPKSAAAALMMPFAQPARYGLGASGWVKMTFVAEDEPPVDLLTDWIEESYRAVAPKRLLAQLDG